MCVHYKYVTWLSVAPNVKRLETDDAPAERSLGVGEAGVVARHDYGGLVHDPRLLVRAWHHLVGAVRGVCAVPVPVLMVHMMKTLLKDRNRTTSPTSK